MVVAHFVLVILSLALHMELDAPSSSVVLFHMDLEVGAVVVRGGQMAAIEWAVEDMMDFDDFSSNVVPYQ